MTDVAKWSKGDLETLGRCPACGQSASGRVFERRDDLGVMQDRWRMQACASCGSIYLDPRPDAASLPAAYTEFPYPLTHEMGQEESALSNPGMQWALVRDYLAWRFGMRGARAAFGGRYLFRLVEPWRLKLDRFGRHLHRQAFPNAGTVLDVGCGNGDFLMLAQAMGWRAEGVEPDGKAVALCQSRNLRVVQGGIEVLEGREQEYDAITLNQVIEHVGDPRDVLARCHRLLKPGGMLWLGYPNPQALGIRVFGAGWCALHPPYHLCLPSQRILREWLDGAGFERVTVVRRGSHARAHFRDSPPISEREGFRMPPKATRTLMQVADDMLATLTPRWAEETVALAWRPKSRQSTQ